MSVYHLYPLAVVIRRKSGRHTWMRCRLWGILYTQRWENIFSKEQVDTQPCPSTRFQWRKKLKNKSCWFLNVNQGTLTEINDCFHYWFMCRLSFFLSNREDYNMPLQKEIVFTSHTSSILLTAATVLPRLQISPFLPGCLMCDYLFRRGDTKKRHVTCVFHSPSECVIQWNRWWEDMSTCLSV